MEVCTVWIIIMCVKIFLCIEQMAGQRRRRKQRKLNCSPSIIVNGKEVKKEMTHWNTSHASTTGWADHALIRKENTVLSHVFDQVILWNIYYYNLFSILKYILKCHLFLWWKQISVFSVTWSFRNAQETFLIIPFENSDTFFGGILWWMENSNGQLFIFLF